MTDEELLDQDVKCAVSLWPHTYCRENDIEDLSWVPIPLDYLLNYSKLTSSKLSVASLGERLKTLGYTLSEDLLHVYIDVTGPDSLSSDDEDCEDYTEYKDCDSLNEFGEGLAHPEIHCTEYWDG